MADTGPTTLSLFSGVGGLDIGWELATGARVVGYCERDAYAASILLARMEDEALAPAPVWCGDVCQLPLAPFHGVDAIIGGFPCQDISTAGKRAGIDGERSGLWGRAFVPAIRELRPRYVFLENVGALVVRGLNTVLADLAALGFDAEWCCLRASAVGAPHRRERVFILAHARLQHDVRHPPGEWQSRHGVEYARSALAPRANEHGQQGERGAGVRGTGVSDADRCGSEATDVGNAECARRERRGQQSPQSLRQTGLPDSALGHAERNGQRKRGRPDAEIADEGCAIFPPGPNDADAWRVVLDQRPHLAPAVEPCVRCVADGMALVVDQSRADQLRCIGNGVVPLQAAVAARLLLRRLGHEV